MTDVNTTLTSFFDSSARIKVGLHHAVIAKNAPPQGCLGTHKSEREIEKDREEEIIRALLGVQTHDLLVTR